MEMKVTERISELLPVIGSAFGWRAISRELVGFIPAIGPGVKGSIAYAGTVATGEAARWYYQTGHHLAPDERAQVFNDAFGKAGELVKQASALLTGMGHHERRQFNEALVNEQATLPETGAEIVHEGKPIQEESQPPVGGPGDAEDDTPWIKPDVAESDSDVGTVEQRPRKKRKKKDEA